MLSVVVTRPRNYVVARTQSYRVVITARPETRGDATSSSSSEGLEDVMPACDGNVFKCYRDAAGITHFEDVISPADLGLPLAPPSQGGYYRCNRLDLYFTCKDLADDCIEALIEDLGMLVEQYGGRGRIVVLTGATI